MKYNEEKKRTDQQNKALHVYYQLLADAFNDAGLDMREVLKPEVEIPWTGETVKEYIWRPIQKVYLKKKSTTDLTRSEVDKVYEVVNRHIAKFGIHEPFPSLEDIMYQEELKRVPPEDTKVARRKT